MNKEQFVEEYMVDTEPDKVWPHGQNVVQVIDNTKHGLITLDNAFMFHPDGPNGDIVEKGTVVITDNGSVNWEGEWLEGTAYKLVTKEV